jgi:DNA polymerase (family 10)
MEITVDGRLDYPDELLARYDVVVASLHVGRKQPRKQLMERYMVALHSPHVDIIAHPSGRKIGIREDLDLDWETFYRVAAETGTVLESTARTSGSTSTIGARASPGMPAA